MGGAYYNEHDPVAAQWLRNLIAAGLIAPGEVDERDVRDVAPIELRGFVQCHFFAGIGIWSHAARRSGWPDDRPLWTGSCPCQPFSDAGRKDGVDDERHLWPHWQWLIAHERPPIVVGEQVASKDGRGWLDLVSTDLEGSGYAFGAANLSAAGFGMDWRDSAWREWLQRAVRHCPDPVVAGWLRHFAEWADQSLTIGGQHIRQRLYFVGLANDRSVGPEVPALDTGVGDAPQGERKADVNRGDGPADRLGDAQGGESGAGLGGQGPARAGGAQSGERGDLGRVGDRERERSQGHAGHDGPEGGRQEPGRSAAAPSLSGGVGDAHGGPAEGDARAGDGAQGGGSGTGHRDRRGPDANRPSGSADRLDEPSGARQQGRAIEGPEGDPRDQARLRRPASGRELGGLADPDGRDAGSEGQQLRGEHGLGSEDGRARMGSDSGERVGGISADADQRASEVDELRAPFDWVFCRDGCWRPVEPGASPLAHAVAARVGKLRAYGNSIDAETAIAFCKAVREIVEERYATNS